MASYLNEIQKNCIYQVNATRVVEGVLEIYDITINGSEEFTPFNQTFLIDFSATNTRVDSLLRFNGNTYSLRFSDSISNGDIAPKIGFIPKRALIKLDVTNSKAIIVSSLDFSEETINFTSATGTVTIPSGLPIGTKKLIRKLNATQGIVTINCSGETFTASAISSVKLNSDGDFWLLEKVGATRWDLLDGKESGNNADGSWICYHTGDINFSIFYFSTLSMTPYITGLYVGKTIIDLPRNCLIKSSSGFLGKANDIMTSGWGNVTQTTETTATINYFTKTSGVILTELIGNLLARWY